MTVSGNWILHYSWGGSGAYSQTTLTFNANHTFSGSYTGSWRQQNGTVMLTFDGGPAKYGGTVNGDVGSGVMSTFSGLDGCWYLSKEGTTGIVAGEQVAPASEQPSADGSIGIGAERRKFAGTTVDENGRSGLTTRRAKAPAKAGSGRGK